jgi:hypothetical protein
MMEYSHVTHISVATGVTKFLAAPSMLCAALLARRRIAAVLQWHHHNTWLPCPVQPSAVMEVSVPGCCWSKQDGEAEQQPKMSQHLHRMFQVHHC